MDIERESDKEMGADRGPVFLRLHEIERVHAMTPRDIDGVPLSPWFAGVRPGTYVRFVPKAIVDAKPWCSDCGQPLKIEKGPAWDEPYFVCSGPRCNFKSQVIGVKKACEGIPQILEEANHILGDMTWIELPTAPRAPWWKRAWARIKEAF